MSTSRDTTYWNAGAPAGAFPALAGEVSVDVAIIGGGIVGVTAARLLKDKGLTVAVVEARAVGRQATGLSTAKVTSQHGLLYQTLAGTFGDDHARVYAEAQEGGLRRLRELVAEHGIDCDLDPAPAIVYAETEEDAARVRAEAEVARRLGLPARLEDDTGLPFIVTAALRFDDQARIHPSRYVAGLARTLPGDGCHVFEGSRVTDWSPRAVVTAEGRVSARHVLMATHLPLGLTGGFSARAYPMAEPVVAARVARPLPGMYLSADGTRSIRTHQGADGATYAIAAGAACKPGHGEAARQSLEALEGWLADHFAVEAIHSRWVNEDYTTMDRLPFIGWSSPFGEGYLVATGFAAWGLTNGTAAGMILAALAAGGDHPWAATFDARRLAARAGGGTFVKENAHVARHLVEGHLARRPRRADDLAPGEGAVLDLDGRAVAAYRDAGGALRTVSATCPHAGCVVGWNAIDETWDCPCHGSRFAVDGTVIHGPAVTPLRPTKR